MVERGESARLSALACETFVDTFGELYSESDMTTFLEEHHTQENYDRLIADDRYALWVLIKDSLDDDHLNDDLFGYAVAGPCGLPVPNVPSNAGELKRLYVRSDLQSSGQGGKLLVEAIEWLTAHFTHTYLSVYADNLRAHRFYERYGFRKFHEYKFRVGEQLDPEWIMELSDH